MELRIEKQRESAPVVRSNAASAGCDSAPPQSQAEALAFWQQCWAKEAWQQCSEHEKEQRIERWEQEGSQFRTQQKKVLEEKMNKKLGEEHLKAWRIIWKALLVGAGGVLIPLVVDSFVLDAFLISTAIGSFGLAGIIARKSDNVLDQVRLVRKFLGSRDSTTKLPALENKDLGDWVKQWIQIDEQWEQVEEQHRRLSNEQFLTQKQYEKALGEATKNLTAMQEKLFWDQFQQWEGKSYVQCNHAIIEQWRQEAKKRVVEKQLELKSKKRVDKTVVL